MGVSAADAGCEPRRVCPHLLLLECIEAARRGVQSGVRNGWLLECVDEKSSEMNFAFAWTVTVWGLHVLDRLADRKDRACQQTQWLWPHLDTEPLGGTDGYSLGVATSTDRQGE